MRIGDSYYTTIWLHPQNDTVVQTIDQRKLPWSFEIMDISTSQEMFRVIRDMVVRGAPLIGIAGTYGIYLALKNEIEDKADFKNLIIEKATYLKTARPTAVNLAFTIDEMVLSICQVNDYRQALETAKEKAEQLKQQEIDYCYRIGQYGLALIEEIAKKKETVNILTHCNAGWLACIDYGTATAPIYLAHDKGINIHVWVDETRPRNQGARLTAWELQQHGVPCTVIADNTGGHLMQHGMVDLVLVGSDRTTLNGDVANKIGTYLKALAASDNKLPFYVALPSSSIDWKMENGIKNIPIEQRDAEELVWIEGKNKTGQLEQIKIFTDNSKVANYSFDVTPAQLITGLITERGICQANKTSILKLFPEHKL